MDGIVRLVYDNGYRSRETYANLGKGDLNDLYYVCDFCSNDSSRGYFLSTAPSTGQTGKESLVGRLGSMAKGAAAMAEGMAEGAADAYLGESDAAYLISEETYTNQTWGTCEISQSIDWILFTRYILLPAGFIITLLSFLLQRHRLASQCCFGRPGLVYPVNLIDNQKHRIPYVAAFTLTSYQMLLMVFNGPPFYPWEMAPTRDVFPSPTWIVMPSTKAFFLAVGCIQYAFIYYPIFATLSSHHVFGYVLGTLYMWALACVFAFNPNLCTKVRIDMLAFNYLSLAPCLICVIYLVIVFPVRVVQELCGLCGNGAEKARRFSIAKSMAEMRYVRNLIGRNKSPREAGKTPVCQRIMDMIYEITPGFTYSPSVLTGAAMAICFSWMVFIWSLQSFYLQWLRFDKHLKPAVIAANGGKSWKNKEILMWDIVIYLMDLIHKGECMPWIKRVIHFLDSIRICYIAASVLAYNNIVICVLLAVKNYKANMLMIYQGRQHDVHPATDYSPATLLLSAARYVGFQTAYATWGFIIQGYLLFIGFATGSAVMNLLCKDTLIFIIKVVMQYFWVTIGTVLIIFLTQYLMGRFLFLLKTEKGETVLALDNRRLYFNFNYFAIFSNTALGVVSCVVRILKSIGLGLYVLPRLDMSTLNRHFEWFDTSFMSFVGLLYLENAHRNPVMLVAVGFLLEDHMKGRKSHSKMFTTTEKSARNSPQYRYKLARNRWLLARTLYNNPGLRLNRKQAMGGFARAFPVGKRALVEHIPIPKVDIHRQQPPIVHAPISFYTKDQYRMQMGMRPLYEEANSHRGLPPVVW